VHDLWGRFDLPLDYMNYRTMSRFHMAPPNKNPRVTEGVARGNLYVDVVEEPLLGENTLTLEISAGISQP
jgi:hypothetical protein